MIKYTHIGKSFGTQEVLKDVNLVIDKPGLHALMGPNGSGKTTLMKSTLGLVKPTVGTIEFNGEALGTDHSYRTKIAYLPQIAMFPENLTPDEFLNLVEAVRGPADRRVELVERFGLPVFSHKMLRSLSGGMRQKVNIVAALMYDTPILLLDEPTIGLDPVALLELKNLLNEEVSRGKYVVVTTHILDFVEAMATEVVFILDGVVEFVGGLSQLYEKTDEPSVERAIAKLLKMESHA